MPRTTRTLNLQSEAERIDKKLDDLAGRLSEIKDDLGEDEEVDNVDEAAEIIEKAQTLEQHLVGLDWALNPPEDEAFTSCEEVTIGALTTGEYGEWTDRVSDAQQEKVGFMQGGGNVNGPAQVFFVATGLVDADFLGEQKDFTGKASRVNQLAPQFTAYLEDQIDELTTPKTDFRSFAERMDSTETPQSGSQ